MDLSSASNASNNAVDDSGITDVDSAIDSAPCIRPNQCLKRQLSQLTHDDDGDPDVELFRSYQESTVAHRLVHSSERGTISIPLHSTSGWPSAHTKPTTIILCQTMNDEHEIILGGLKYNSNIDSSYQIRIGSIHRLVGYCGLSWSSWR
jgi:hypothetical protein